MTLDTSSLATDAARAIGFLTRLPVPSHYFEGHDGNLSQASRAFPVAGLAAALPAAVFLLIAPALSVPPLLAATIAVAILAGTTGALHEDGLADIADGFFGGKDIPQRLEIMGDSRLGTYGVLILILAVMLKVSALHAVLSLGGFNAGATCLAAGIAARTALVWHWVELDPARPGGLADKMGKPTEEALSFALVTGVPIAALLVIAAVGLAAAILALVLAAIASFAFARLCRDKIGGFTGDTLGASAQIVEIATLIALACSL